MVLRRKPVSNLKFYISTRLKQLGTKDERTNSVMADPTWPWRGQAGQGRLVLRLAVVRDLSKRNKEQYKKRLIYLSSHSSPFCSPSATALAFIYTSLIRTGRQHSPLGRSHEERVVFESSLRLYHDGRRRWQCRVRIGNALYETR